MIDIIIGIAGIVAGTWAGIWALELWWTSRKNLRREEKDVIEALKAQVKNYSFSVSGRGALSKEKKK